jgi:hypothetical protein
MLLTGKNSIDVPPSCDTNEDANTAVSSTPSNDTTGPVRYSDGAVNVQATDLISGAMGIPWNQTRAWTNLDPHNLTGSRQGYGWTDTAMPYMYHDSEQDTWDIVLSGRNYRFFEYGDFDPESNATFASKTFAPDTLSYSASSGEFTLSFSSGTQFVFMADDGTFKMYDPPSGNSEIYKFAQAVDVAGHTVTASYDTDGMLTTIQRTTTTGSVNTVETNYYSFFSSGENETMLHTVTMKRQVGSGSETTARSVEYSYYTDEDDSGDAHKRYLKTAVIKDAAGNAIDTSYYRYDWSTTPGAGWYGLQMVFGPQSFQRLKAKYSDPFTATNEEAQPYADNYFEYDDVRRVTKELVQNAGCSCSTEGGRGEYNYTYAHNWDFVPAWISGGIYDNDNTNRWKYKTTEELPDGNERIVFLNQCHEVLLNALVDAATEKQSIDFYQYDYEGRLVMHAYPSAVTGYDDEDPTNNSMTGYLLLKETDGSFRYLSDTSGRIDVFAYYDGTTADNTTAGGADGYKWYTAVRHGEKGGEQSVSEISTTSGVATATVGSLTYSVGDIVAISGSNVAAYNGSWIVTAINSGANTFSFAIDGSPGSATSARVYKPDALSKQDYLGRPFNSDTQTIYPVNSATSFANIDQSGARTTSYAYSWVGDTGRISRMITNLPAISGSHNGPGTADKTATYYDAYGRISWTQDGDGYLNYSTYDDSTGAVTKQILGVDTSQSSDFTGKPTDFPNAVIDGPHIKTVIDVDNQGRATKVTDPDGNVAYTVYNDIGSGGALHESRTYRGFTATSSTSGTTTGPIEISRTFPVLYTPEGYSSSVGATVSETLTLSAAPHVASSVPDGGETISASDMQTLSRNLTNAANQVVETDRYVSSGGLTYTISTPVLTSAVSGTDYYATTYGYDDRGRRNMVGLATGTLTYSVYDARGLVISTWVGTDDSHTDEDWTPDTNTGNMSKTADYVYDYGLAGDGNLTTQTQHPGTGLEDRVSRNYYDWRDRLVVTKNGQQTTESSGDNSHPLTYYERNNLSEVTAISQYDADNVYMPSVAPTPPTVANSSFETPALDPGDFSWASGITGASWTFGGTYGGIVSNGSAYGNPDAPDGQQAGLLQTYDSTAGYFQQSIASWPAGTYTISFQAARRDYGSIQSFEVFVDGTSVAMFTPDSTDYEQFTTPAFTVASGTHTIKFQGEIPGTDDYTDFIDQVSLNGIASAFPDTNADGVPDKPDGSLLRSYSTTEYDDRGRVFATHVFSVDPADGTVSSSSLNTSYARDRRGDVIKRANPGGLVTKTVYDGAGRGTKTYTTDGNDDNLFGDAGIVDEDIHVALVSSNTFSVELKGALAKQNVPQMTATSSLTGGSSPAVSISTTTAGSGSTNEVQQVQITGSPTGGTFTLTFDGQTTATIAYNATAATIQSKLEGLSNIGAADTVLEQSENQYDANGNVIFVITKQRFHDETATGELGNASTSPKARVSYMESYYDAVNRLTDSVNVGTYGGSSFTRDSSVPSRSDTKLVTSYLYNAAGWREFVENPRYVSGSVYDVSGTLYDMLGRTTRTVAAYSGTLSTSGLGSATPASSTDQITEYTYDGRDHVLTMMAVIPDGPDSGTDPDLQTTQYIYGLTQSISSISTSSGYATVTTTVAHGYKVGQSITISGANSSYNNTWTITHVPTTTTFKFAISGSPSSASSGNSKSVMWSAMDRPFRPSAAPQSRSNARRPIVHTAPANDVPGSRSRMLGGLISDGTRTAAGPTPP